MPRKLSIFISLLLVLASAGAYAASPAAPPPFMTEMARFAAQEESEGLMSIGEKLAFRAESQPFLVVATVIFLLAIIHTFFAVPITQLSHRFQHEHEAATNDPNSVSFKATLFHFFGEVEAIFGIWVIVLLGAMFAFYGLDSVTSYMMGVNFTEPLFVVVIMALASTRPVLLFAETCLGFVAKCGKESPAAWWLTLMIVAPLLGSFITEPGAMTIAAMLLAKKFYSLKPSPAFAYATLGLLFVNISIGGLLTNFAAPPVLMVAAKWGITTREMLLHYGDKAVISILLSSFLMFFVFRRELASMRARSIGAGESEETNTAVPFWITIIHLAFMAFTVAFAHYPPLFIGAFLFYVAFAKCTASHQSPLQLKGPVLVGFFLAGLVIHGGLQGWWLAPIISSLGEWPLFIGSMVLTSFNDNAAITFLASQVEGLGPQLKYAVLAGAVTGGGLTVIANAPNPAGQAILSRFFGEGVSPVKLALAALVPTLIVAACMMFLPDRGIDEMFAPVDEPSVTSPANP